MTGTNPSMKNHTLERLAWLILLLFFFFSSLVWVVRAQKPEGEESPPPSITPVDPALRLKIEPALLKQLIEGKEGLVPVVVEMKAGADLEALESLGLDSGLPGRIAGFLAAVGVTFGTFALLYRTLPLAPLRWRDVLPGAIVATILFEIGKSGFLLYLSVADYEAVYGSLSAIIVLMIWLVVSAWVFLVGAEYNSTRQRFLAGA